MLRIFFVNLFCFVLMYTLYAQEYESYQQTDSDIAYREFRAKTTVPPYGLSKVKALLKNIKPEAAEYGDASTEALSPNQFKSLTLREKFTYVMIHPEIYAQNCAIFMPLPEEDKKIFSHLISWMDESEWSDRQINFLRDEKDSVMALIRESTLRSGHMGVNYKDAIATINGWQMIPFLIDYYTSDPKDKDVLTLLLLLMRRGEYVEFLNSASYRKLYGADYNYEAYISYNKANEDLIIQRAKGYYDEKTR